MFNNAKFIVTLVLADQGVYSATEVCTTNNETVVEFIATTYLMVNIHFLHKSHVHVEG